MISNGVTHVKIVSQMASNQVAAGDQTLELKEGEVYSAKVKEKLSHNEAIVQIRGKDVKVRFEGSVPQKEQIVVQVSKNTGDLPVVRIVSNSSPTQPNGTDVNRILSSLGIQNPSPDLKAAIQLILDRGMPVSKESIRELQNFLVRAQGSMPQKLESIKALLSKNVELTLPHFQAVHEALHGNSLGKTLNNIVSGVINSGAHNAVNQENSLLHSVSETLLGPDSKALSLREQVFHNQIIALANQLKNSQGANLVHNTLEQVRNLVQVAGQELNTQENNSQQISTQQVSSQAGSPVNNSVLQEIVAMLQNVDREISQLPENVKDTLGKDRLLSGLEKANELFDSNKARGAQHAGAYNTESELQASMPFSSKDLIVTEITKRLALATDQFQNLKREITRNLDHLIQMTQATKSQSIHHSKPLLESTIDTLDKAILKSEITALTDMKTEKQLMHASSELAKARAFLEKGDHTEATRILREVKELLQSLNWKPSDVKVKHFITKETLFMEDKPQVHRMASLLESTARINSTEPSARHTFELVRALGLNHDSEAAQQLTSQREQGIPGNQNHQDHPNRNMKALIMQSLKDNEGQNTKSTQQLQQALQHITGQQILSKADGSSQLQSMFFNLPLAQGSELKDIKVYINSKKGGEKVDWENCSLYFLFETKKIGDTGILISATNRNLSITIKNDQPNLKEKLGSLVEACKENLNEIGYHIVGVNFSLLTTTMGEDSGGHKHVLEQKNGNKTPQASYLESTAKKGFDFKV